MYAPLDRVLIVDLSRHLPGPFAARMLANLGARVIKVEEPELGDPLRAAPPFHSGRSLLAESLLAGLQSIALDLKKEGGKQVLSSLLERADVLLETFRPGTLAGFGFSPERLRREYPRLIVCSISGWGQEGPMAARAGHDLTYQAAAGALTASGRTPHLPSADFFGAWAAISAINAALFAREKSGAGAWIDAALLDAAMIGNVTNCVERLDHRRTGTPGHFDPGQLTGALPCYRVYRTADGRRLAVAALEPKFWRAFCEAAGRKDLVGLQYDRRPDSHRAVAELVASRSAGEWQGIFERYDIPGEVLLTPAEAQTSGQASFRGLDSDVEAGLGFPALIEGSRPAGRAGLPRVGEHTRAVLAEFGSHWLRKPRRQRLAAGVGPRLSLKRSLQGWVAGMKS